MAREPLSSRLALLSTEPQRWSGAGEQGWDGQNNNAINNDSSSQGLCAGLLTLPMTLWSELLHCPPSTDEETAAYNSWVTCPRSGRH